MILVGVNKTIHNFLGYFLPPSLQVSGPIFRRKQQRPRQGHHFHPLPNNSIDLRHSTFSATIGTDFPGCVPCTVDAFQALSFRKIRPQGARDGYMAPNVEPINDSSLGDSAPAMHSCKETYLLAMRGSDLWNDQDSIVCVNAMVVVRARPHVRKILIKQVQPKGPE